MCLTIRAFPHAEARRIAANVAKLPELLRLPHEGAVLNEHFGGDGAGTYNEWLREWTFSNLAKIGTRCPTTEVEIPDAGAVVVEMVQRRSAARPPLVAALAAPVSRPGKSGHRSPHGRPDKCGRSGTAPLLAHAQPCKEPKR